MTYDTMKAMLAEFTPEELHQNATIYITGEFAPILRLLTTGLDDDNIANGILDNGHLFFTSVQ